MSVGSLPPAGAAPLGARLAAFARDAVAAVSRGHTAYFYHLVKKTDGTVTEWVAATPPDIHLDAQPPTAFVDCSTWVHVALSSVAPHHAAALDATREDPLFNPPAGYIEAYDATNPAVPARVPLRERMQPWARANVASYFFAHVAGPANGFSRVSAITDLQAGDLLAWSLGIYADPANPNAATDPSLTPAKDTGHVVVVAGPAVPYPNSGEGWPNAYGLATAPGGQAHLAVYAVPVIDASDVPHADDSRTYRAPPEQAPPGSHAGGLGSGTLFFSIDASGAPQQFCFSDGSTTDEPFPFFPSAREATPQRVTIAAARPV
ncbi:hypothetical protein [Methylobacterium platani]|uniref:Uncharacterized protein n=2 Tax=Methylobacterium platani TaxID=427683 RepID=A0A179SBP5_9HYPH|nr:hypothetical protein [Methylobacterium platani]KMO11577.1 hypothetical protein SQ03_26750 [Methylobacterium platani JCM 14648]OAS24187.1 hypothetical protein A5481_15625 [Methylobacterium platani]